MLTAALLNAVFVVAVLIAKDALMAWWTARRAPKPAPLPDALYLAAVREACVKVGLPREQLGPDFDLVQTGKLYDVLHHAAALVRKDHELRTTGDVADWLSEAPDR